MGAGEILLILILALIIWGPGKLPEIARTLGRTIRAFRKTTFDLTSAITREIEAEEKRLSPPKAGSNPEPQGKLETGKTYRQSEANIEQQDGQ